MLNCRHVTRLISQSMDAKLPWYLRMATRIHLLYCVWCRRYAAQVRFLSRASKQLAAEDCRGGQSLSPEAKEQMRARLQSAIKDSGGT
jgi:hypothetical protein